MPPETTYLLIGLGNPGREYRDNRHNIGFMLIDRLAVRLDARGMKVQSKAIVTTATYQERKLILAKPQTYMNLSGHSAQGLLNFYKIPVENMIVAHDDLDLPFGTIRSGRRVAPVGRRAWLRRSNSSARTVSRVCGSALAARRAGWTPPPTSCRISPGKRCGLFPRSSTARQTLPSSS